MRPFYLPRPDGRACLYGSLGAAGLFLGMANPCVQLPLLALLYPAMLALLGRDAPDRGTALRRGWLCGMAGAGAGLYWIVVPIHAVAGQPLFFAALSALLLGAYIGLYGGLFSVVSLYGRELPLWRQGLLWASAWFLLEWVRNSFLTGFPWLPLAAAFVPWPAWIQAASLIGAYALGGVLAAAASLFAVGMRASPRPRLAPVCAACLMLAAITGYGQWQLDTADDSGMDIPVTLVQGNIDQNQKWDHAFIRQTVDTYIELSTRNDGPAPQPTLTIWPETAVPFDYERHALARLLRDHASTRNTWLIFGAPGVERAGSAITALYNRAYLIGPDGRTHGMYEKEHLVPFGEYVPWWLDLPFLRPLLQGVGEFTPGKVVAPLALPLAQESAQDPDAFTPPSPYRSLALGVLICYETIFPELSRQRVADGAMALVNISNDAWFGLTSAPEQHLHLAALRAVEQRRFIARGTNTGISAIIDPWGRFVVRGGVFEAEVVHGVLRPREDLTVFFFLFYWLPPLGLGLFVLAAWPLRRRAYHLKPHDHD